MATKDSPPISATYYDILGVYPEDAIDKEKGSFDESLFKKMVGKSYKKLALQWHPDLNNSDKEIFFNVKEARDTLIDKDKREKYDEELEQRKWQESQVGSIIGRATESVSSIFEDPLSADTRFMRDMNIPLDQLFHSGPASSISGLSNVKPQSSQVSITKFEIAQPDIALTSCISRELKEKSEGVWQISLDENSKDLFEGNPNIIEGIVYEVRAFNGEIQILTNPEIYRERFSNARLEIKDPQTKLYRLVEPGELIDLTKLEEGSSGKVNFTVPFNYREYLENIKNLSAKYAEGVNVSEELKELKGFYNFNPKYYAEEVGFGIKEGHILVVEAAEEDINKAYELVCEISAEGNEGSVGETNSTPICSILL